MESLARAAGDALLVRGWRVAAAESCTAGLVLKALTDVPGSSRYVLGGVVAYADRVKHDLLGVDEALLSEHGAVSEPVARAMAEGVARVVGAEVGIAITGIAGPDGGTPAKPVGTVWVAVAVPGIPTWAGISHFGGDRAAVREQAARRALELLAAQLP
jgi:PncC family amidohydrolase